MARRRRPSALPARTLASDADREGVAAALQEHYEAGRLRDAELEHRLAGAFAARTLGDLRRLVADLPGQPPGRLEPAGGEGRRRTRRGAFRHVLRAVGVVVAVLAGFGILAAVLGTASQQTSSAGPASVPEPPPDRVTSLPSGATGVDDGIAFRVRRVRVVGSVPFSANYRGEEGGRLAASGGRALAVVGVEVVNRGSERANPFCGSNGARMYSRRRRGYELVEGLYRLRGNEIICSEGLQPGEGADVSLVFGVPKGTVPARLDLWNSDAEDDVLGHTRLRTSLAGAG